MSRSPSPPLPLVEALPTGVSAIVAFERLAALPHVIFFDSAARDPRLHAQIIERFTGPDYGWMWPFRRSVQRWINEALSAIERELGS